MFARYSNSTLRNNANKRNTIITKIKMSIYIQLKVAKINKKRKNYSAASADLVVFVGFGAFFTGAFFAGFFDSVATFALSADF